MLSIGHDITEKRQAERELSGTGTTWEELVFSRTAELAGAGRGGSGKPGEDGSSWRT